MSLRRVGGAAYVRTLGSSDTIQAARLPPVPAPPRLLSAQSASLGHAALSDP